MRVPWIAALPLLLGPACQVAPESGEVAPVGRAAVNTDVGRPDILLVLVQHLREDGLPDGAAVRFFRALGRKGGVRYTAAYAQSPSPTVSLGSLLTGHYPSAIPLCDLGNRLGDRQFGQELPWCARVPPERRQLPAVLGLYGYQTALFSRGQWAADANATAFAHHDDLPGAATDWQALTERFYDWWAQSGPAPRFAALVVSDLDLRRRPDLVEPLGLGDPEELQYMLPLQLGEHDPLASLRAPLYQAYCSEAERVGQKLATLLDGLSGDPLVVVTSTVGMNLGERAGLRNHTLGFFSQDYVVDRSVHVPLWISPTGEPALRTDPVELVDLFPTLTAWAHATPPHGLPGRALEEVDHAAKDFAEYGPMLAVRGGPYLLTLHRPMPDASAADPWVTDILMSTSPAAQRGDPGSDYALHDVVADPLQEHQIIDQRPDEATALHQALRDWRVGPDAPPTGRLTPEQIWELRMNQAFGYW
jgi:arylsulfatase A-like enzyme